MAKRREPRWLDRIVIDAVHADQVRQHGGLAGLRDEHALESALARPRHTWLDEEPTDLATLAAAYAFGLSRSHPYRDGNKRIAFLALVTFLGINGHELEVTDAEVVAAMVALADGRVSESSLAEWVRQHIRSEM